MVSEDGGKPMPKDDRNTVDILRAELDFVKKGGYTISKHDPWRTKLALEDSPTCMNYANTEDRSPCAECLLMQFVPLDKRGEKVPCRHIPMNSSGDTLLHLYRGATEPEIEEALANWLRRTIDTLEGEKSAGLP
jgi:hypothetical protein